MWNYVIERYGLEMACELEKQISQVSKSECYVNNERAAECNDAEALVKYEEAVSNGCCGYSDGYAYVQGRKFKIGFNYGH